MKLQATYVSVGNFNGQYFQVSFHGEDLGADLDLSAPMKPYLLLQRQFEDYDDGVCYIETHEPHSYAGHVRLHLVEFARTRLVFDIDRPTDRRVEVTFTSIRDGSGRSSASFASFSAGSGKRVLKAFEQAARSKDFQSV